LCGSQGGLQHELGPQRPAAGTREARHHAAAGSRVSGALGLDLAQSKGSCLRAQAGAQATAALVQQGKQQRTVQGQQGTATALVFLLVYL